MKRQATAAKGRKIKTDPAAKAMLAARKDHRHPDGKKAAAKKACRGKATVVDPPPLSPSERLGWILSDGEHGYCVERDDQIGILKDDDEAQAAARKLGFHLDHGEIVGWSCPHCGGDWLQHAERYMVKRAIHFDGHDSAGAMAGAPLVDWESGDEAVLECRNCLIGFPVPLGLITEWE